jgi:hypothetical protein
MARRLKLLLGLSTVALTGAAALSACAGGEGEGSAAGSPDGHVAQHGEAEGEGSPPPAAAGGEAEGAALADVANDKSAYLSALEIVRGHLRAGVELYSSGDRELGPQHLRHPQAEIMTTLSPAFASYGAASFEPALDALAAAAETGAAPAEISALHSAALRAITEAGAAADASTKEMLLAVAGTLTVAGDEYSIGVKDGKLVNLHEYHDAYGFIATAISDLEAMTGETDAERQAIAAVLEQARKAAEAAPSVAPPASGLPAASTIYGAAARAEIAARGL